MYGRLACRISKVSKFWLLSMTIMYLLPHYGNSNRVCNLSSQVVIMCYAGLPLGDS